MNVLILGATGRVGSHIVQHALDEGHQVTALVRSPDNIQIHSDHLTVIQGNAVNIADITQAMHGVDAVMSALNTDGATTLSASMPLIIEAMYNENIQRIITIGTAGILQSRTYPHLLRYQSPESKRKSNRAAKEHHQVYQLLKDSTLDWTMVCPTYLPDGERLGVYRVERDVLPEGGVEISAMDTAEFAYKQLEDSQYTKSRVGIAY